ncbi:Lrp/AsnC family transcriptional regulator [Halocynthiibacter namhaensis]|uniref:Lrp/AsnC family transcriptional regulator n=1 Tax=Halocynthiibacter namhaensis TaxID=1290553 RepID=UPI0005796896|nr:Lrp/AsnC family transcriptional regulator [Halocynthiibacter namhaensis]
MDERDRDIIAALRRDSRASLSELAGQLKLSRTTIRTRIERLVARGDIVGFTVVLKEDRSQSPVRGHMMLGIEGHGTDRIVHRLSGLPEVQAIHATNGKWDLIIELGATSLEALDAVLGQIRRLDGVQTSETNLLLATRKSTVARG